MRMALIRDGVAVNIIEAEKGYEPGKGLRVVDAANADIGARFNGKSFEAASPAPAPVPAAAAL